MARNSRFKDMLGFKTGKITVIKQAEHSNKSGDICWEYICECGRHGFAAGVDLRRGMKACNHCRPGPSREAAKKISLAKRGKPAFSRRQTLENANRAGYLYFDWVKKVLEEDDYRCRDCGISQEELKKNKKTKGLNAHHIKDWDSFPKLRFEVSNGEALCHRCHRRKHIRITGELIQILRRILESLPKEHSWLDSEVEAIARKRTQE